MKRQYRKTGDMDALRALLTLADDTEALAELDREIMGQSRQVQVNDVGVRHG